MYYAVKIDKHNQVVEKLDIEFTNARECFMAARKAFGVNGRLQCKNSRLLLASHVPSSQHPIT